VSVGRGSATPSTRAPWRGTYLELEEVVRALTQGTPVVDLADRAHLAGGRTRCGRPPPSGSRRPNLAPHRHGGSRSIRRSSRHNSRRPGRGDQEAARFLRSGTGRMRCGADPVLLTGSAMVALVRAVRALETAGVGRYTIVGGETLPPPTAVEALLALPGAAPDTPRVLSHRLARGPRPADRASGSHRDCGLRVRPHVPWWCQRSTRPRCGSSALASPTPPGIDQHAERLPGR